MGPKKAPPAKPPKQSVWEATGVKPIGGMLKCADLACALLRRMRSAHPRTKMTVVLDIDDTVLHKNADDRVRAIPCMRTVYQTARDLKFAVGFVTARVDDRTRIAQRIATEDLTAAGYADWDFLRCTPESYARKNKWAEFKHKARMDASKAFGTVVLAVGDNLWDVARDTENNQLDALPRRVGWIGMVDGGASVAGIKLPQYDYA